jgi:hypothetical protein
VRVPGQAPPPEALHRPLHHGDRATQLIFDCVGVTKVCPQHLHAFALCFKDFPVQQLTVTVSLAGLLTQPQADRRCQLGALSLRPREVAVRRCAAAAQLEHVVEVRRRTEFGE